ncbi:prolyl-tRNA synthetase [Candidatus Falkowbacteria bacterium CG10_big_fil_rev_8_21_14_0_10_39_11]|uniref:Proline--tRNA ligase n=1 Tax=Candidatus Falkowbacteria bacterium CG10_big_fil_rev_8_21_14_0_10_39_11 TaxID=1974565 RepID=A0A2H0V4L5_9BACT|nr:MAG: prolyl-tRNA synthetase [Candidatus Falkowbacteria bacterium CG10_big_fil_rev_8_21_14_0_10_39_11]
MRQSQLFTKTTKDVAKEEVSKNAQFLLRAGYIHKEMAGAYDLLPLGLMVVEKIKEIVRQEMNKIGGVELIMTALQRKELWEKTDRWDDNMVDVWFKSELVSGNEVGFGWSHEEPMCDMIKNHISSYRDLPVYVYQFQTKMRNEKRAKSGLMRGREFVMKDMYSFNLGKEDHTEFYNGAIEAYKKVFDRVGLGDDTYVTFASGGAFTEFSHEFQTVVETGEDTIYLNQDKSIAINEEVLNDKTLQELGIARNDLQEVKTAEVGNIFNFGTAKSEQLGLYYTDEAGTKTPVWLGSYGIGITRLMGVLVEKFADDRGIVWTNREVAPFDLHLVSLLRENIKAADELYEKLGVAGYDVLYDDRPDARAGQKFADSDLIGIPFRIVVSEKTLDQDSVEFVNRKTKETELVSIKKLEAYLTTHV